jgi:hypothetical protein
MSEQRQRLLALGILAVAIGLVWLAIVAPIADAFAAQSEDIAQSRLMLDAYARRIAMRPVIEAKLAEIRRRQTSSTGLVPGTSAELAAAGVQATVKTLIESDAGQITSVQNLPPTTKDGFQRIEVQYDLSVPMTKLRDVVYRIETAVPYLFIDGVELRAPENWQGAGVAMDPPNLQLRWTVHAYRWARAP